MKIDQLYRDYYSEFVAYASKIVSASHAEDMVQTAFERLIKSNREPEKFLMICILRNTCIDFYRRNKLNAERLLKIEEHTESHVFEIEFRLVKILCDEIDKLPKQQAQIIKLYYLHEINTAKIANIIGCTQTSITTQLQRARYKLANRMIVFKDLFK